MGEEDDKNDLRVEDRRYFDREGNPLHQETVEKEEVQEEAKVPHEAKPSHEDKASPKEKGSGPPPKIDFPSFLLFYVQTALVHLGEIEDPIEQKTATNLDAARSTIDILEMLREKTKGNLSPQEEQYFDTMLFDLRLRFVEKAKGNR